MIVKYDIHPFFVEEDTLRILREFVLSSSNNNYTPDNGVVAFLYLYTRLFSSMTPLVVELTSDIPIGGILNDSLIGRMI